MTVSDLKNTLRPPLSILHYVPRQIIDLVLHPCISPWDGPVPHHDPQPQLLDPSLPGLFLRPSLPMAQLSGTTAYLLNLNQLLPRGRGRSQNFTESCCPRTRSCKVAFEVFIIEMLSAIMSSPHLRATRLYIKMNKCLSTLAFSIFRIVDAGSFSSLASIHDTCPIMNFACHVLLSFHGFPSADRRQSRP